MIRALITTVPFAERDPLPVSLLQAANVEYLVNPLGRKLSEEELAEMIGGFDVVIAGTEPITDRVMARADRLKLISRVGIGLDSVDLLAAERRGIGVSYTPDAPAPAVAELTIGLMLSLLRSVQLSNLRMHQGEWHRYFGRRLGECTVGIIGAGRIGSRVIAHLAGFGCRRLLVNDLNKDVQVAASHPTIEWCDKETIYREADVISIHVPLTRDTRDLIGWQQLSLMKPDVVLINTARGGIINEKDLFDALTANRIGSAAIDVFDQEPYRGPLASVDRCLLTAHMGSMSVDCRTKMEIEATEEAIRFIRGERLLGSVPRDEYDNQR